MVVYKVFKKNYKLKKGEFMGMLIERRRHPRELNQIESGLRWAKLTFGRMVKDKNTVFVVPDELNRGNAPQGLMEKLLFTKEELFGGMKLADQGMRSKEEGGL
jgi:hypothetical protein